MAIRPEWNEYWFTICEAVKSRSSCPRFSTGSVVVSDNNGILTTGYNGAPRNVDHCNVVGCYMVDGHCVRASHGEENAICQAAREGIKLEGSRIYVLGTPCIRCSRMIIQAGIKEVYVKGKYRNAEARHFADLVLKQGEVTVYNHA